MNCGPCRMHHHSRYILIFLFCTSILSPLSCDDVPETVKVATTEHPQNLSTSNESATDVNKAPGSSDSGVVNELKTNSDVVQASFDVPAPEGNFSPQQDYPFVEAVSQNAGIANGIGDAVPEVVVTLVDTATSELQQRAELSSQQHEEQTVTVTNNTDAVTETLEIKNETNSENKSGDSTGNNVQNEKVDVPIIEPKDNLTEEIPSFSEWAQKQLEEAEKKREEVNSSSQNQNYVAKGGNNLKVRSKNYASPDCGAKIVGANPEAGNPSAVLSPSRDEYKLNTCTSRIWFIVELCEAIQAKKIDLANFELFSSSPKEFSVSVSDRYPSREWSVVGHFTAKDERDVQSFDLNPHLFGKYIKLEMHSHHGSEHFCPISLFRVYGTSEFEVLEKEDQPQTAQDDDDDDETLDSEKGQGAKNLFHSATDAVMSIVKKAAEVLGNKGNQSNQTTVEDSNNVIRYTPLISTCTTPSHIVVCDNCSDVMFGKVFELLSCRAKQLNNLLAINLIRRTVYNSPICVQYGLDFYSRRLMETPNIYSSYVKSFFPPEYLAALCNTVAVIESKVVLNVSNQLNATLKDAVKDNIVEPVTQEVNLEAGTPLKTEEIENTEALTVNKIDVSTINEGIANNKTYIAQIKPTKTLTPEELIEITHMKSDPLPTDTVKSTQTIEEVNQQSNNNNNKEDNIAPNEVGSGENTTEFESTSESSESLELDHLISDFNMDNSPSASSSTPPPQIKESVFLRLSNRIKTLERNMSLSSQYLEELSRRYKKQVEEMQRFLEKTIIALNEESKRKDERNTKLEDQLRQLTEVVEQLVAERNNSFNPLHWLVLIVVSMFVIFTFCRRNEYKYTGEDRSAIEIQRRKSIDVINHNAPPKKERRPSEEALKISGTYEHLLVDDVDLKRKSKERKRKKKKLLQRSNSITTLSEESSQLGVKNTWSEVSTRPHTLHHWTRQESAPPKIEWNGRNGLEDIPFVLEESDIHPLQDLPLPKPLQDEVPKPPSNNGDIPLRKVSSPAFLRATATEMRKLRKSSPINILQKSKELGHKKSASVDETKRQTSPSPSTGNESVNSSDEPVVTAPKKEKRGTFKKIFKKVF